MIVMCIIGFIVLYVIALGADAPGDIKRTKKEEDDREQQLFAKHERYHGDRYED